MLNNHHWKQDLGTSSYPALNLHWLPLFLLLHSGQYEVFVDVSQSHRTENVRLIFCNPVNTRVVFCLHITPWISMETTAGCQCSSHNYSSKTRAQEIAPWLSLSSVHNPYTFCTAIYITAGGGKQANKEQLLQCLPGWMMEQLILKNKRCDCWWSKAYYKCTLQ